GLAQSECQVWRYVGAARLPNLEERLRDLPAETRTTLRRSAYAMGQLRGSLAMRGQQSPREIPNLPRLVQQVSRLQPGGEGSRHRSAHRSEPSNRPLPDG